VKLKQKGSRKKNTQYSKSVLVATVLK